MTGKFGRKKLGRDRIRFILTTQTMGFYADSHVMIMLFNPYTVWEAFIVQ